MNDPAAAGADVAGPPLTVQVPGLVLTEHELRVPLDPGQPDGEQIGLFAREVAAPDGRDRAAALSSRPTT